MRNGLYATLNQQSQTIDLRKIENNISSALAASVAISIAANDAFDFTVTDDGTALSATFTEFGGDGSTASITSNPFTFSPSATSNLVSFANREGREDFLDFVSVDAAAVPEPASFGLLGIGAIGLMSYLRRKRKQAGEASNFNQC